MRFLSRAGQSLLGAAMVGLAGPACYSAGGGTSPPTDKFYFPVGLAVSENGNVLYAVNSDFDLQFNGGTLQSYDLGHIRTDATNLIDANVNHKQERPDIPFVDPSAWHPNCTLSAPPGGKPLGESCSPPVQSTAYRKFSAVIGAFASGLQISTSTVSGGGRRLFVPVRGDVTLTWADIGPDSDDPFRIDCGQGSGDRCDATHRAGNDPNQVGNTRNVVMPGEPFGMAQTEDGTAVVVTHQTDTKMSLLTTGLPSAFLMNQPPAESPTMQFVLDGLPNGGVGVAAVPHDPDAPEKPCERVMDAPPCVKPAFLETSRTTAEIDLVRFYNDNGIPVDGGADGGAVVIGSSLNRPYLQREAAYPITSNAIGTDSRGIVIDPTLRIACKAQPGAVASDCATTFPARVFFASRTPPALGIGQIGGTPPSGGGSASYDPDYFVLTGNVPLPNGPSNVYLAPIVDSSGNLALRVFIVCFDSNQIVVYDPGDTGVTGMIENVIDVGPGPFAMAFDPFTFDEVATHGSAKDPNRKSKSPYRFAYVASFTQSFVQMIDLDNSQLNSDSQPTSETFERVVFTLGQPTLPKGQ